MTGRSGRSCGAPRLVSTIRGVPHQPQPISVGSRPHKRTEDYRIPFRIDVAKEDNITHESTRTDPHTELA